MPDNLADPFSTADKERLDASLLELDQAEQLITKGKLAGMDLSAQETSLKATRAKLRKIKQVFFPNA